MVRRSILSGRWYPDNTSDIEELLTRWTEDISSEPERFSAIVPHAGWYYSGRIAARALKKVCDNKELVIIIGGHLPAGSNILAAFDEEIETPWGRLNNRTDLISSLKNKMIINEDLFNDNTVEVIAAMLPFFVPQSDIIWLRAPADQKSFILAEEIYELLSKTSISAVIIGSTDLTHYGSNYSFKPKGSGIEALRWVKEENDAEIVSMLLELKYKDALNHAEKNKSACSAGAAAAAAYFAELNGKRRGELIEYMTSYDVTPSESFVGYAGIIY